MSTDDSPHRPTTVAAVQAARRDARAVEEKRRAEAQERADRRPARGWGRT
jgi:regulator of protease activity HflC (stomatin/prohibitin superfamily)